MKYYCETCGKIFTKEQEALQCEEAHAAEQLRAKAMNDQKESRKKEVEESYKKYSDLLDKYIKDYGATCYNYNDGINELLKLFGI